MKPLVLANCCICSKPVDTREESEGGDPHGSELTNGKWVCSGDCWDVAVPGFEAPLEKRTLPPDRERQRETEGEAERKPE